MTYAKHDIGNLIADAVGRQAWIKAGMPSDLATVAKIVLTARMQRVQRARYRPTFAGINAGFMQCLRTC